MADDIELAPYTAADVGVHAADTDLIEEKVPTSFGNVIVGISGDRKKRALITFHDLGLNANSCFQSFFQFSEMSSLSDKFCIYHINAPGQEDDAEPLPENFVFPTMDALAEAVESVVEHFGIKAFIGLGVGAGANVLVRYALNNPKKVDGLILINCVVTAAGWIEWGYQKVNSNYLRNRGVTAFTVDYLMWHHFGKRMESCNQDMVTSYRQYFSRLANPTNLAMFIDSYLYRTAVPITREGTTLECPVLQMVGGNSGFIEESVDLNSKLNPQNSDWIKVSDSSGLLLEDRPDKATEAILLFLQGLGYFPTLNHCKFVQSKRSYTLEPSSDTSPVASLQSSLAAADYDPA
uniref:Protein NDRG3 n=1 Tax=Plectus sambesii TaxID=2011161 RepID=A0A914WLJ7_9BILA